MAGKPTTAAFLIDPTTAVAYQIAPMNQARAQHALVPLSDGRALAMGGIGKALLSSVEVFDPSRGTWTMLAPMSHQRAAFAAVEVSGGVLVTGGQGRLGSLGNEFYTALYAAGDF